MIGRDIDVHEPAAALHEAALLRSLRRIPPPAAQQRIALPAPAVRPPVGRAALTHLTRTMKILRIR